MMKHTTERKWHSWLNGVVLTTWPLTWVRQRSLWLTSGETLLTIPHWPSTAQPWRELAALNSWECTLQRISPGPPTSRHSTRRPNSASTFSTFSPLQCCWPQNPTADQFVTSLEPSSPPSWIFSSHDAPARLPASWRTPPTHPSQTKKKKVGQT